MTRNEEKNYAIQAEEDARGVRRTLEETLCEMWRESRELSTDLLNDYRGGDEYHHSYHTDKSYSLSEAAEILERLSDFEETTKDFGRDFHRVRQSVRRQRTPTPTRSTPSSATWLNPSRKNSKKFRKPLRTILPGERRRRRRRVRRGGGG